MMQRWSRFRRLSGFERGIVLEAAAGLLISWLAVRLLGFRVCRSVFGKPLTGRNSWNSASGEANVLGVARRIAHLEAETATNLFFRTSCLEQSLALCRMLRHRGMNADLRIGARKRRTALRRMRGLSWMERFSTAAVPSICTSCHLSIPNPRWRRKRVERNRRHLRSQGRTSAKGASSERDAFSRVLRAGLERYVVRWCDRIRECGAADDAGIAERTAASESRWATLDYGGCAAR